MSGKGVNISIMGREFSVSCGPEEEEELLEAARHLDKNMKEIQKSGRIIGAERCAIMAALNITNDFLKLQKSTSSQKQLQRRLQLIHERIDEVLLEAEAHT